MRFSDPKKLDRDTILQEDKGENGVYILLDEDKNPLYIGHSGNLPERLMAVYYGRSDYAQVEKKKKLSRLAEYYRTVYISEKRAKKLERRKKSEMRFNQL